MVVEEEDSDRGHASILYRPGPLRSRDQSPGQVGSLGGPHGTFSSERAGAAGPTLEFRRSRPVPWHKEKAMRRKTFDALLSTGGLVIAGLLIISGALLTWGHSFATNQVHTQLSSQKVFFPDKAAIAAQK